MSARAFAIVMGAIAVVALLAYGLLQKGGGGVQLGEPPPAATLPVLDSPSAESAALADFKGGWVLANVWASWCVPCRDEAPALENFSRRHRDDLTVVGIDTQDNTADALAFVDEFGLTYDQLHDGSGDYAKELGTSGVPESVLIDPEGVIAYHVPGQVTDEVLASEIEPLIEGEGG